MEAVVKTINALTARRNLGRLLEEAYYRGDEIVIERAGKPMAVLVSIEEFEKWQEQREKDFFVLDEVREANRNVEPKKVEKDVAATIKAVRRKG